MADWRRERKVDHIWRMALIASFLVHFCVVVLGLVFISKHDKLIPTLQISFVNLKAVMHKTDNMQKHLTTELSKKNIETLLQKPDPPPKKLKNIPPPKELPPKAEIKIKSKPQPSANPDKTIPHITTNPRVEPKPKKDVIDTPLKRISIQTTLKTVPQTEQSRKPTSDKPSTQDHDKDQITSSPVAVEALPPSAKKQNEKEQLDAIQEEYLNLLRNRIDRFKKYPLMARKGRQQGVVWVVFTLSKSGALQTCQLKKSCGYHLLDRAAIQAVQAAAPFSEVPPDIYLSESNFVVPVRFILN